MRLIKIISILIANILIVSSLMLSVSAEDQIDTVVDASFNIELVSATDFKTSIIMSVLQATAFGTTYDQTEIIGLATSTDRDDIEALGVIKNNLHLSLYNQIKDIFEKAEIIVLNDKPTYSDGKFHEEYSVNITSSYFEIDEEIDSYELVNGLLDMGAVLNYNINLQAEEGWNNTYLFDLGTKYSLSITNGNYNHLENTINWIVRNGVGTQPNIEADLSFKEMNPTTTESQEEDIFLDFVLDSTNKTTSFQSNIMVKTIDISQYDIIPSFITNLTHVTSDGIRLLEKNQMINWEKIYEKTIQPMEDLIKTSVETQIFNQSLNIAFDWDEGTINNTSPYEVQKMDDDPPVTAILRDDDIKLKIFNIPVRGLFGLINSGATTSVKSSDINFGDNLNNIGYQYNISLMMPTDIILNQKNIFTWNDTLKFSGNFSSEKAKAYSSENIDTTIVIDIENTDLNLLSIFSGSTELTFGLDIEQIRNYNVTELPEEFSLPEKIKINFLNSDALRLCIDEKIFTENMISDFLNSEKNLFENRIATIISGLEISGNTDRNVFDNSLTWDEDIGNMDSKTPVTTHIQSYTSHPINLDLSVIPPGFKIRNQRYTFSGIENQSVTYKMFFPKGVSIHTEDDQGKSRTRETQDGQFYIEVFFSPADSNLTIDVSCEITPSILFILGVLMPCFVALFIAIILIVVIVLLRRRRKSRPIPVVVEESHQENEDYYPPAPGSK